MPIEEPHVMGSPSELAHVGNHAATHFSCHKLEILRYKFECPFVNVLINFVG